jgi:NADPH:quinone reductase-like Zn-dependent oxidoreductase
VAKIPHGLNHIEAAAIPEAFITAHDALFTQANLCEEETLLIHAVGSGVGLAALQLAKAHDVKVFGTSRSNEKLQKCIEFGLDVAIYADEQTDFSKIVLEESDGANVILDLVGANYLQRNLESLALKGRLILVGLTGGRVAELDMGIVLAKRLKIIGTVLRTRTKEEKAEATQKFAEEVLPLFEQGKLKPNLDRVFPFTQIREAHEYLESNKSFGKIVLNFGI